MPFRDPKDRKRYTRDYQARVREGERVKQPETLEAALVEVRELRAKFLAQFEAIWLLENQEPQNLLQALAETRRLRKRVVQNSKRLWFLKNKEKQNVRQRRRRNSTDLQKALVAMRKIDQATKNPTSTS